MVPHMLRNVASIIVIMTLSLILVLSLNIVHQSSHEINMAVEFNNHASAVWVALEKGFFESEGLNIKTLETFTTGLELSAALDRGDIQVAWACLGPLIMAYSKGVPIKIVAMAHTHGYVLVVKPEIENIYDLEGKTIACPGKGSPNYLLIRLVIEKYNLKNVKIVYMKPPLAMASLISGNIDGAVLPEHYASLVISNGFKPLIRSQDIWRKWPGSFLAVREELLRKNPELVKKLIRVTVKATIFINGNMEEAAKIVASKLKIPYEIAFNSMKNLEYVNIVDPLEVQKYIDLMYKYGCLRKRINVDEVLDLTLLNEVLSETVGTNDKG